MKDKFKIGIDYGGTKIEAILMNDKVMKLKEKDQSMIEIMSQGFQQ